MAAGMVAAVVGVGVVSASAWAQAYCWVPQRLRTGAAMVTAIRTMAVTEAGHTMQLMALLTRAAAT